MLDACVGTPISDSAKFSRSVKVPVSALHQGSARSGPICSVETEQIRENPAWRYAKNRAEGSESPRGLSAFIRNSVIDAAKPRRSVEVPVHSLNQAGVG